MAFKMKGFSGFKQKDEMTTRDTDRGGKRKIKTTSTPTIHDERILEKPTDEMFDEKVEATKRGGKVKKIYDTKTGEVTKTKYKKDGTEKVKTRKTSDRRIQKLAKKSGTTSKTQYDKAKDIAYNE